MQLAVLDEAVLQMLAEDLPVQHSAVHAALQANDPITASHCVHKIHGSAAFCKLEDLRRAAEKLEESLKNKDKNAKQLALFDSSVRQILDVLEQSNREARSTP